MTNEDDALMAERWLTSTLGALAEEDQPQDRIQHAGAEALAGAKVSTFTEAHLKTDQQERGVLVTLSNGAELQLTIRQTRSSSWSWFLTGTVRARGAEEGSDLMAERWLTNALSALADDQKPEDRVDPADRLPLRDARVETFAEAGLRSDHHGVVVQLEDGTELTLTVKQTRKRRD